MSRSIEPITKADLARLGEIVARDRRDFFTRNVDTARLYSDRLFAVALCQGGALHYLDGRNGIKDLDAWSFFTSDAERPFPYRRRATLDFGNPKFGTTPDNPQFIGRRIDHIGRSIATADAADPVASLTRYLHAGKTSSARHLAEKAVVLIEPAHLLGTVVWPQPDPQKSVGPLRR